MADRLALVIAVDSFQDADVPPTPHAEADAAAFARALEPLGFVREHQVVLLGSQATKTAIESRLRKLVKAPPAAEALFVFFAGHAFGEGEGHLACFDTQADDLAETSVPLGRLLDAIAACDGQRIAVFLDTRCGLPGEPLPAEELAGFFRKLPTGACFLSCRPGETSHISGSLKSGIWAHHVVEALTGKAPRALDGTLLTAASLQVHLEQELPRTLRATFREAPAQTPALFAADAEQFVVADLAGVLAAGQPTADPRLQPLKRGSLRGETTAKVKSLAGYRKFHRLPDRVNAGSRKFVAELAAEDVRADVDHTYAAIREQLGYKRRDVEGSADRGSGFVRTPDFEYSVSVDLADDDPTTVVWRREVAGIRNPEVVLGKPFQQTFGETFDTLVFEFTRPFDLEAWVDRIEEEVPAGLKLRCASDCSSCDVVITGFAGVIRLLRDRVEVQGRKTPGSKGLVEAFLHFQDLFSARRDLQQLPLLEEKRGSSADGGDDTDKEEKRRGKKSGDRSG
jgi:hypothetical protein